MWKSDFVYHSYDYRLNWTPLSTIITCNHVDKTIMLSRYEEDCQKGDYIKPKVECK